MAATKTSKTAKPKAKAKMAAKARAAAPVMEAPKARPPVQRSAAKPKAATRQAKRV